MAIKREDQMSFTKCKHRLRAKKSTMELVGVSVDGGVLFETYECYACNKTKVCKRKI